MNAIFWLIETVLSIYIFFIIALVIMSWLIVFQVVNRSNQFVFLVEQFLTAVTEPLLGPIRRAMPNLGGIDISPLILLLAIYFLQKLIVHDVRPLILGY